MEKTSMIAIVALALLVACPPTDVIAAGVKTDSYCDATWKANNGNGCEDWGRNLWCKKTGDHYGSAWKPEYISFMHWADDNQRTALVCPQCGCIDTDTILECDAKWKSFDGYGCKHYSDEDWCQKAGNHYGPYWNSNWISFEKWADKEGRTALVCPQCGCTDTFKLHQSISNLAAGTSDLNYQSTDDGDSIISKMSGLKCDANWKANNGLGCKDWGQNLWCKKTGDHYGSAWKPEYINFRHYADDNERTALVCPQCGCIDTDTVFKCDADWKANNGHGCKYYSEKKYCKKSGNHYGSGWDSKNYITFERYADKQGRTALVCPECGCTELKEITNSCAHRLFGLKRISPDKLLKTRFFLNTRKLSTVDSAIIFTHEKIRSHLADQAFMSKSTFNPQNPTKILIHGFNDNKDAPKWIKMMTAILAYDDVNVFRVEWNSKGADYKQKAVNTQEVGGQVATLIEQLTIHHGMQPAQFHIIGHSLGAHTAGFAGAKVGGLGRITGLDPAGPCFDDAPRRGRLDSTDAVFVDVIHTDGKTFMLYTGYGSLQPCGHVDFYPNGGLKQPGCETNFLACNHGRAVELFISSLESIQKDANGLNSKGCQFEAQDCQSYKRFKNGDCDTDCDTDHVCGIMGERAGELKGKGMGLEMYLKTSSKSPYCI